MLPLLDPHGVGPVTEASARHGPALADDELRFENGWLEAQMEAFRAAMNSAPLASSLGILVDAAVDQATDGRRCAFYIADAGGKGLRHVVGMPGAYAEAVDGLATSPESLACELATETGQPVITPEISEDPRWLDWAALAREYRYRGCWSFPVETTAGKLVGSLAMYFAEPRRPDARDLTVVASMTQAAAVIIFRHQQNEEHVRAETASRESEERLRQFGEASQDVLWIRDVDALQWLYLSPAFEVIYGLSRDEALSGNNFRNWQELILPEDRMHAVSSIQRVAQGEQVVFEYRIRQPVSGEIRWLRDTDFPIYDAAGKVWRIGGVGHDVTGEKAVAARLEIMVAELQHRTRNLLAVVRGVARRSIGPSPGRDDYEARLAALGRVQGVLSRSTAYFAPLADLVAAELEAIGDAGSDKVIVAGPPVELPGEGVQAVALALHELATNAAKYGAIAQPAGRLSVTWWVGLDDAAGRERLVIDWRESGVVMPRGPPTRRGYGNELITKALPYQLHAETLFEFKDDGVWCRIVLPAGAFSACEKVHP